MDKQLKLTVFTLWANRLVGIIMIILLFALKPIINWYCNFRVLLPEEQLAITIAFYICSVFVLYALWNMERLLRALRKNEVFVSSNVALLRRVQWCCGLVSLVCVPACFAYIPIVFIAVIMAFLCLCISVVSCIMDTAVALREENDLTI